MFTIHLNNADLVETRFAFSPLWEIVTSYRVIKDASRHALYLPWIKEAGPALATLDLSYLDALILKRGYFPDFLTPPPECPSPSFEDEIVRIRQYDPKEIQADVLFVYRDTETPESIEPFLTDPMQALEKLIETLELYWKSVLFPHWERIQTTLEGDVLYRSRQLALNGFDALFSNLHHDITYENGTMVVEKEWEYEASAGGLGLVLVPVMFSWPDVYCLFDQPRRITIGYSPRGAGLWMDQKIIPDEALDMAFGTARAAILNSLQIPRTTGELAKRLHVTSSAISQQLARLRKAGLVEPARQGNKMYYRLTMRGEGMVELFS